MITITPYVMITITMWIKFVKEEDVSQDFIDSGLVTI